MKNAPYWTAVVLGMLIILVIYIIAKRRAAAAETFVGVRDIANAVTTATTVATAAQTASAYLNKTGGGTTTTTKTATSTSIAQAFEKYFEGDNGLIPFADKLYIYLSSFSGVQSDQSTPTYSGAGVPIWRSLVNEQVVFNVVGTDLPASIMGGLPMLGTRLIGPPSENTAFANTNWVLPSFTAAWYANWKSLDFDTDAPIILLRMFAENPNHVQISVREKDSTTVTLDAVVGNASSVYSWDIPKTTLLTQGTGTLYAFVYNREEKKISFNIGSTIKYPRVLTDAAIVKLGNTPIDINYNQNWNADLKAFMFYRAAITDFSAMFEYLGQQASGIKILETTTTAEKEALQKTALSDEDLAGLRDELELTRQQLYQNRLRLRKCMQKPEDVDPHKFRRWQVKDGLYPGVYDKLNQCRELNINSLDDIKARLAQLLINAFAAPLQNAAAGGVRTQNTGVEDPHRRVLYTTFPNDGFKKKTNQSIYVATPYPEEPAKGVAIPYRQKEIVTQFGAARSQPRAPILTAELLPTPNEAPAPPSSIKMSADIPVAEMLPRVETSAAGVTLLYADPVKGETIRTPDATSTIPDPNMGLGTPQPMTTTMPSEDATVMDSVSSGTASARDDMSIWDRIKEIFV